MDLIDYHVTILNGKLEGTKATSTYSGKLYYKFCGIPYAQPPVGSLRFQPPQPPNRWSGILNASKEKDDCVHYSLFLGEITGSEDCLYVNVYTPEAPRKITTPKPVIVQIHQGGHMWGGSSTSSFGSPDFFIHRDIIYVTFNYRLHILGFLNLNIPQCPGNMGLKDQNLALKWIKENIEFFGGDPNNITLYGNSSGASDIHLHMMSPSSKDLFHKAILLDGYALNPIWSYENTDNTEKTFRLARTLNFKGNSAVGLLRFLKRQDPEVLLKTWLELRGILQQENPAKSESCIYLPTIEAFEEDAFMTISPRELIKTMEPKPVICSVSAEEGLIAFCANPIHLVNTRLTDVIKGNMWMYNMDEDMLQIVAQELRSFYYDNKEVDETMTKEIINMYTDMWYCEWNDWLNQISKDPSTTPVYLYCFDHIGELNYQQKVFSKYVSDSIKTSATHSDSSAYFSRYLFGKTRHLRLKITPSDQKIINYTTHMFTNFAKYGDPNGDEINHVYWTPFNPDDPSYLLIRDDLEIIHERIFAKRHHFWQSLMKRIKSREIELARLKK